jgi:hypothetical protein
MHEKAKQRYEDLLRRCEVPASVDALLDQYADNLLRATEWDADHWGLPTPDMIAPLAAILSHAGGRDAHLWPREVI